MPWRARRRTGSRCTPSPEGVDDGFVRYDGRVGGPRGGRDARHVPHARSVRRQPGGGARAVGLPHEPQPDATHRRVQPPGRRARSALRPRRPWLSGAGPVGRTMAARARRRARHWRRGSYGHAAGVVIAVDDPWYARQLRLVPGVARRCRALVRLARSQAPIDSLSAAYSAGRRGATCWRQAG